MSFILDALKKSESKRRAQAGPEWSVSPTVASPAKPATMARVRVLGLSAVVLLLLTVGALWAWQVFVLKPSVEPPLPMATSPTTSESNQAALSTQTTPETTVQPLPASSPMQADSVVAAEVAPPEAKPVASSASSSMAESAVATLSSEDASVIALPQTTDMSSPEGGASDEALVPAVMAIEEALVNAQAPRESAATVSEDEAQAVWQPAAPDYLYQWELPLAVRQALPALNLTIHVFAANPADRFVLINGVRYTEGAELGSGAVLAEIRAEGALVDFRDYRFLLTR